MRAPAVSVVIPAFNERECADFLLAELPPVLAGLDAEIIVVDDGSTDGTGDALARHPDFQVIRIEHAGKSAALLAGVKAATGRAVVMIDADLQEDPQQIGELLERLRAGAAMASGVRTPRTDGLFRKRIPAFIYRCIIFTLFWRDYPDINCGFRAASRDVLLGLPWFDGVHWLLPLLVVRHGWTLAQIPVRHRPRRSGRGKFDSPLRFADGLRDLLMVRFGLLS